MKGPDEPVKAETGPFDTIMVDVGVGEVVKSTTMVAVLIVH